MLKMKVNGERIVAKAKRSHLTSSSGTGAGGPPLSAMHRLAHQNEAETEYNDVLSGVMGASVDNADPGPINFPPFTKEPVSPLPQAQLHYLFFEIPFEKYQREYAPRIIGSATEDSTPHSVAPTNRFGPTPLSQPSQAEASVEADSRVGINDEEQLSKEDTLGGSNDPPDLYNFVGNKGAGGPKKNAQMAAPAVLRGNLINSTTPITNATVAQN